ncbi:SidA/IucD/PvdA family monooxygenase [Longispora albida]|uniref:SidA/IucD/PvdA family monooxygenase n=1 Tax=Longispora albida TaxID=203523 RepID=UPI00036389E8|nr:SidA/IucD/PvdA family monooxygenase [Longispora albida]
MNEAELPYYHTVGVGAGPANLSLAALYEEATTESLALFEKSGGPQWHPGLIFPGVSMQTSWMKDLVTLVDPRHKLTFLNYMVTEGRLFALLNSQFATIPRKEYERYIKWAARQIPNIHYSSPIDRISFGDGGFTVYSDGRALARSEHLVVGVGSRPYIPEALAGLPADRSFIADHLSDHIDTMDRSKTVAVVGGGQTGLEKVSRLLSAGFTNVLWIGRQPWFQTIDDSSTANDIYRPNYNEFLHTLSRPTRKRLVTGHRLTGDGITPGSLAGLYQQNYNGHLELGRFPATFLPGRNVDSSEVVGDDIVLHCRATEKLEEYRVGYVVVAVGREITPVPFDSELAERIDMDEDGEMIVDADYSVRWKGMNGHRIYAFNRARWSHGIQDGSLTQLPLRAAMVINSILGREVYKISDEMCQTKWS